MSIEAKFSKQLSAKIEHGAQRLEIPLQGPQVELLVQLLLLIGKWNRVYNLTSVRSMDQMVGRHILDSLSVLQWLPPAGDVGSVDGKPITADVLDVGSGAGLPVLPLAIVRPDLEFLSVESNGKKTRFQHQAVLELALKNVQVKQARIEDVSDTAVTIISRAFAAPDKFIQAVAKNCLPESQVIIMLGQKAGLPEKLPLGFVVSEMVELDVPQCDSIRHVAICDRLTVDSSVLKM